MANATCKQCHGTGLVSLSTGPEPIAGFSSACSCNVGNAIWDVVLNLIHQVETDTSRLRIDEANRQIRSMFQHQKSQESKK